MCRLANDPPSKRDLAWVVSGSLVLCLGATLIGVFAFRYRVLPVAVGFVLFAVGYWTMQFGVHEYGSARPSRFRARSFDPLQATRTVAGLTAAVGLSAWGFVTAARATRTIATTEMLLAGLFIVTGYVVGHLAVNNEVL